jgi:type II secretion system protein G
MLARGSRGFTLIELLIVVAIIAILAAIAVPNFLEAQVRSKVSRCKSDMRTLATAMESYKIDANHYPPDILYYGPASDPTRIEQWLLLYRLSTPVAYVTSIPADLFVNKRGLTGNTLFRNSQLAYSGEETIEQRWGRAYNTHNGPVAATGEVNPWVLYFGGKDIGKVWAVVSKGPDLWDSWGAWFVFGGEDYINRLPALPALGQTRGGAIYDPTNGSLSDGDIVRSGP